MSDYFQRHSYDPATIHPGTPSDELIRPGLHLAYPLPPEDDANNERFRRLLDALAQRDQRMRHSPGGCPLST